MTSVAPSANPRLLHEAVVVPHDELRLQLADGVHRHAHHDEERGAAEEAARLARQRYRDGVSDFLDVLDSERVALSAQSEAVASGVRRSVAWVTVYKAMGGGWTMTPEKPGTSSKKKAE